MVPSFRSPSCVVSVAVALVQVVNLVAGQQACQHAKLYTSLKGRKLVQIDMDTDTTNVIGEFSSKKVVSLEYDFASNQYYGLKDGSKFKLVQVNPNNAAVRVLGKVRRADNTAVQQLRGLAMDASRDVLYTYSQADRTLYTVNPTKGTAEAKFSPNNVAGVVVTDLVFRPKNGLIYATTGDQIHVWDPAGGGTQKSTTIAIRGLPNGVAISEIAIAPASAVDNNALYGISNQFKKARIYEIKLNNGKAREILKTTLTGLPVGATLECTVPPSKAPTPAPTRSPAPTAKSCVRPGIEQNVNDAAIADRGWVRCYSGRYGDLEKGNFAARLKRACGSGTGSIMVGCRPAGGQQNNQWQLVGYGSAEKAFTDTGVGQNSVVTLNGDIQWYYSEDWSFGFSPAGVDITKDSCDVTKDVSNSGKRRLCWHTRQTTETIQGSGYRCGTDWKLNESNDWERAAWKKEC